MHASIILGLKGTNRAGIKESNFPVSGTREKERNYHLTRHQKSGEMGRWAGRFKAEMDEGLQSEMQGGAQSSWS